MSSFNRRDFLKTTAGVAAGTAIGGVGILGAPAVHAQNTWTNQPEKGAKLRVLRWKRFVAGDEDAYLANVKKFTEKTGIEVRVDNESWEDVRPKAAVAANVGTGPDIILSTNDDANLYPDKLIDVSDVCNYLGKKYGGWYPVCEQYLKPAGKWIGVPLGCRRQCGRLSRKPGQGGRVQCFSARHGRLHEDDEGAEGKGHAGRLRARPRHRRPGVGPLAGLGVRRQAGQRAEPGRHRQPGNGQGAGIRERTLSDLRSRHAVVAGSRTTTRRSSTTRSASPPTGFRSTTPRRPRPIPSSRKWPRTSSMPTFRSDPSACRPNSTCSSTR